MGFLIRLKSCAFFVRVRVGSFVMHVRSTARVGVEVRVIMCGYTYN